MARLFRRSQPQLEASVKALEERLAEIHRANMQELDRIIEILQLIHDDEPETRRRLGQLRASPDYELAFTEEEPLVSVVIPTYRSYGTLRDRAIPSVLGQSYQNFEIVVVGDAAPPETGEAIASFAHDRIVYENLRFRGPYPEDAFDRWNVTGVAPYNAAVRRARGRWISPFADDDALRPDALETMVRTVQRERYEACYGKLNCILEDGREVVLGSFPPEQSGFGLQGGLYHAGLSFIEQELGYHLFRLPNDWAMVRRMLRAGVRFGFVDAIVADYHPTSNPLGIFDPEIWVRDREAPAAERSHS
jgi:glycosyltransferase involved in cell wall biosynthesis